MKGLRTRFARMRRGDGHDRPSPRRNSMTSVKVGMVRSITSGPTLIAIERGYYKDVGINVEWRTSTPPPRRWPRWRRTSSRW